MKNFAYVITRQSTSELIEDNLFAPLGLGKHGGKVSAIFFIGDGVYHLLKGSRIAKNIKLAMEKEGVKILACEQSVRNRKVQNLMIDSVLFGTLKDFYDATTEADHIIAF